MVTTSGLPHGHRWPIAWIARGSRPSWAWTAASSEGSINPLYGIRGGAPYGGVCLPKDTCGFLGFAGSIGVDMPLLRAVVEVNDRMEALTGHELDSVVERDMSGADVA